MLYYINYAKRNTIGYNIWRYESNKFLYFTKKFSKHYWYPTDKTPVGVDTWLCGCCQIENWLS